MRKKLSILSSSLLLGSSLLLPASVFAESVDATTKNSSPSNNIETNQSNLKAAFKDHLITFVTSNEADAGTDSLIWISIIGSNGKSSEILLNNYNIDNFERGKTDVINFSSEDVGQVQAIALKSDGSGWKSGWLISKITLDGKQFNIPGRFFGENGLDTVVLFPK